MTVVDALPHTQETELRARASSGVQPFAGAISSALNELGSIRVRAIGAGAVNQAIKAIAVARGYTAVRGKDIHMTSAMENTQALNRPSTSGGDELTCIVLRLWTVER